MKEWRISQGFLAEQRETLSDREFQVLYKAEFPETSEDALINWEWIQKAQEAPKEAPKEAPGGEIIIAGCDIAEQGNDLTVVTVVAQNKENKTYRVLNISSWGKTDLMPTVAKITPILKQYKVELVRVDATGVGSGVYSRLDELLREGIVTAKVEAHKGGLSPHNDAAKIRFLNQKAESYWHLRSLFEAGKINIPVHRVLISELSKMKWELTSAEKIRIRDPGDKEGDTAENKSPDFADSLNIAVWGGGVPALMFSNVTFK